MKLVICKVGGAKKAEPGAAEKVEAMAFAVLASCEHNDVDYVAVAERLLALSKAADAGKPCWKAEEEGHLLGLENFETGAYLGVLGGDTEFVDCKGVKLKVGDLVEVNEANGQALKGLFFVHHKSGGLFRKNRVVRRVKSYKEVELGELHGDYVVVSTGRRDT